MASGILNKCALRDVQNPFNENKTTKEWKKERKNEIKAMQKNALHILSTVWYMILYFDFINFISLVCFAM